MGNNVHTADDGTNKYSVTRGCSSFDVDYDTNCYEVNNDDAVYSVCKDFCIGENCNNRLPSSPIANGNEWPSCLDKDKNNRINLLPSESSRTKKFFDKNYLGNYAI